MNLPKLSENFVYIKTNLPSNKSIGVRGWVVKDEKALLYAVEQDPNPLNKVDHIVQFMRNCVDNQKLYDTLSEQDLKQICIELRKLSKGAEIEFGYTCPSCSAKLPEQVIDISKSVKVQKFDTSPIIVNNDMSVSVKELSYNKSNEIFNLYKDSPSMYSFKFISNSIDALVYKGTNYTEFTPEEMEEFLDQLSSKDLEILYAEFEKRLSEVKLEKKIKCPKCKEETELFFGDLFSFLVF